MDKNQKLKFRITLKAYDHSLLQRASSLILEKVKKLDEIYEISSLIKGPIHLPRKKRYYSVLRSPHGDKDSHEQFEIRSHKWFLDILIQNLNYVNILGLLDIPSGVEISTILDELY